MTMKKCVDCAHQEVCKYFVNYDHECIDFLSGSVRDQVK
jgi:hypothetical protein